MDEVTQDYGDETIPSLLELLKADPDSLAYISLQRTRRSLQSINMELPFHAEMAMTAGWLDAFSAGGFYQLERLVHSFATVKE
jgi:hypothetical protein